ncbi:hypothetical protein EJ08DRAFT_667479 [Tothia fuscella]|uniref:Uncharacterized protein n=1 Tax=Tothia fuscella TaxID=1048955 RepID=A0A9P4P2J5_9PEZI|nr:hypothetical protein EJ08DRAFT_667479 [Tothia fuscella]
MTREYIRCDSFGCYQYSTWDNWVRWVVLTVIIILFVLTFFFCSCVTARRRRRAGQSPYYGTGWAARNTHTNTQPYYNNQYAPPPPVYSPNVPNGHQQYYGQQSGIELQQPQHTYAPGRSDVYEPPVGPPPTKA